MGDQAALEHAARLDPQETRVRLELVQRLSGAIEFATYHLPGYVFRSSKE